MKKQLPHGVSNFEVLRESQRYYVDRTNYIALLESVPNPNLFFLRPRKFGKSLFISTLQCYYGMEYKEKFPSLFGDLSIGKNPTTSAGTFHVLKFDFSAINTDANTEAGFIKKINSGIVGFNSAYSLFDEDDLLSITQGSNATECFITFLDTYKVKSKIKNLMILIDEYDHFTHELISFDINQFKEAVSRIGYVRKFYEAIKEGVGLGLITRFFATGVTPVTLDSFTSGFNIATNLTMDSDFNSLLGFTESDLRELLNYFEVSDSDKVLEDLKLYYNGSLFSRQANEKLYNSTMVLYFLDSLIRKGNYPEYLIDTNVMSDYGKMSNLFLLDKSGESKVKIEGILKSGETAVEITRQFTFEREFSSNDLLSLLFYHGLLTLKLTDSPEPILKIPNLAISKLFWTYYVAEISRTFNLKNPSDAIQNALRELAINGEVKLLLECVSEQLGELSNRDLQRFDEKYIKMLFMAYSSLSNIYIVRSEVEFKRKYADLYFRRNNGITVKYDAIFELKYLKISERQFLAETLLAAENQLKEYLDAPELINIAGLVATAVVFVGPEVHFRVVEKRPQ